MNNMEDFQEKMNPIHRENLCRMLRMEQLPECLLKEYLKAKKMIDIIDGSLAVGELAILALMAGYNPNTGKFLSYDETIDWEDARLQAQARKLAAEPPDQQAPRPLDESDDKVIEDAVEQPVPQTDEQAKHAALQAEEPEAMVEVDNDGNVKPVSGATGQAVEQPASKEETAKLWSPGMPVRALHDEEFKLGKIVGVSQPSEVSKEIGAAVIITVELEGGDTVTVEEDEVEAV